MAYTKQQMLLTKERLRDLRKERGITTNKMPVELAEVMTGACLLNYEEDDPANEVKFGKTKGMSIEKLVALADFYGVSCDYLLGRSDSPSHDYEVQELADYIGVNGKLISKLKSIIDGDFYAGHAFQVINAEKGIELLYKLIGRYLLFAAYTNEKNYPAEVTKKLQEVSKILDELHLSYRYMDDKMVQVYYRQTITELFQKILDDMCSLVINSADELYGVETKNLIQEGDIINEVTKFLRQRYQT